MKIEDLKLLIEQGEGLKLEFKENLDSKSISKEITAFANSEGGRIFLGVSDKGEVKGVQITNKLKSEIQDTARNCEPSVKINLENVENVLIISVEEGKDKPYQCSAGFYLREGPNSQKLSRDEILKFITGIGKIKFDEQINDNFKFPEDFDENKFNEFLKRSRISNINNKNNILINLSLGEKAENELKINNAGILFFGKNIKKFIRQNFITCVLYKGKERVDIIDRKDFNEDLITNYDNSFKFLKQHLKLKYLIKGGGPREEILEIPEEALKESLLNSIVHRDYFESGMGIFVEIFDDRVEIYNKGKLLFDKRDLGKISISRNPILFDMFSRIDLIEKAGSGINRIKKLVKESGGKVYFQTDEFFRIIFSRVVAPKVELTRKKTVEKSSEKILQLIKENSGITRKELGVKLGEMLGVKLGENNAEIIRKIAENKFITSLELSKYLSLSITAIENNISKLKKIGIIKRVGPDKGGYWEIIK